MKNLILFLSVFFTLHSFSQNLYTNSYKKLYSKDDNTINNKLLQKGFILKNDSIKDRYYKFLNKNCNTNINCYIKDHERIYFIYSTGTINTSHIDFILDNIIVHYEHLIFSKKVQKYFAYFIVDENNNDICFISKR